MSAAVSRVPSSSLSPSTVLSTAHAQEMKEFHFHTYFFQTNPDSLAAARAFRAKIAALVEQGYFKVVLQAWRDGINTTPLGPHVIGSFETWDEIVDHTARAVWLGQSVPMDFKVLRETLDEIPLQYPELGLGYSAKEK
ncbi:hypothetical protein BG003_003477 [Podila horticola]|nr:hypothetical protein BG003_003477 [Podila horticola]